MGEKGVKRSCRSGSSPPCEQPLVHVWSLEEKCAGKRERCCESASAAIREIPGDGGTSRAGGLGLCLILHIQPAQLAGVCPPTSCVYSTIPVISPALFLHG